LGHDVLVPEASEPIHSTVPRVLAVVKNGTLRSSGKFACLEFCLTARNSDAERERRDTTRVAALPNRAVLASWPHPVRRRAADANAGVSPE